MAAYTTSLEVIEIAPNAGLKTIVVESPHTLAHSDTLTVYLDQHGITASGMFSVAGYVISDQSGCIVTEEPTTAVSTSAVLTLTIPTGFANRFTKRVYLITGESK